jgi:hypothetical protein
MPCLSGGMAWRREDHVGRSPYQSEKRRKELARLKKQEEKRQRRFNKKHEGETSPDAPEGAAPEGSQPPNVNMDDPAPAKPAQDQGTQPPQGTEGTGETG